MKSKTAGLTVVRRELSDLKPHPQNPRVHPPEQLGKLESSLEAYSYTKGSIVVQKGTDTILAGHGVYEALKKQGYTEVDVIEADLPDGMAEAFMVADNKLGDDSLWDEELLNELLEELAAMPDIDIEMTGFDQDEFRALIGNEVVQDDFNVADALEEEPITQTGDLWLLGSHKLLCGDSTKKDDVDRVMGGEKATLCLTDPPYNVDIDYGIHKDDYSTGEYSEFCLSWFGIAKLKSNLVVFTPGLGRGLGMPNMRLWYSIAPPDWILVWIKKNAVGHSSLGGFNNWEPIFLYGKPEGRIPQDIYDIPITVQSDVADGKGGKLHPTPKQVKFYSAILSDCSVANDFIYDPFLGSGTTLIAADQLDRICYGLEIEPRYCDVIVKRYINHVGHSEGVFVESDGKRLAWEDVQ